MRQPDTIATSRDVDGRPRQLWRRWFVVLVIVLMGVRVPGIGREAEAIAQALLGAVVGAAWQLAYRRDLVDRLVVVCVIWLLLLPVALLPDVVYDLDAVPAQSLIGVLAGLVVMEFWLRSRVPGTVGGRP